MKKIFTIFVVAALFVVASTTAASAQIYYGVKAGANITTVSAFDALGGAEPNYGYQVGAVLGAKIPLIGIGVEAEALWANNKFSVTNLDEISTNSIDVPVMVVVPVFPMLPIYIKAGPVFTLYQSDSEVSILGQEIELDPLKSGVGYTAGLGVKLYKFTLDVRYNGQFSKSNAFSNIPNSDKVRVGSVCAMVGYRF